MPGEYSFSASKRTNDVEEPIGDSQSFMVVATNQSSLPANDRQDTLAFQRKVSELQKAAVGSAGKLSETLDQLSDIKRAIRSATSLDGKFYDRARALENSFKDAQEQLTGDRTKSRRYQTTQLSIMRRTQNALSGTRNQTYGPTKTHREQYRIGKKQLREVSLELKRLIERDFAKLVRELDKAGLAWTPGRRLPGSVD